MKLYTFRKKLSNYEFLASLEGVGEIIPLGDIPKRYEEHKDEPAFIQQEWYRDFFELHLIPAIWWRKYHSIKSCGICWLIFSIEFKKYE